MGRGQGRSHLSSDPSLCPSLPGAPTVRASPAQGHVELGAGWAHRLGIQPSTLSPEAPCIL